MKHAASLGFAIGLLAFALVATPAVAQEPSTNFTHTGDYSYVCSDGSGVLANIGVDWDSHLPAAVTPESFRLYEGVSEKDVNASAFNSSGYSADVIQTYSDMRLKRIATDECLVYAESGWSLLQESLLFDISPFVGITSPWESEHRASDRNDHPVSFANSQLV